MNISDRKRQAPAKPSDSPQKQYSEKKKGVNRDEPQDDSAEPMHRGSRSEVDDFAPGPRQPQTQRGGFASDRGPANPGGTAGEHSGQKADVEGKED